MISEQSSNVSANLLDELCHRRHRGADKNLNKMANNLILK